METAGRALRDHGADAAQERQLPDSINRSHRAANAIEKAVDELENRLVNVLVSLPPEPPGGGALKPTAVASRVVFAEQLDSATHTLDRACQRLNSILSRLEL